MSRFERRRARSLERARRHHPSPAKVLAEAETIQASALRNVGEVKRSIAVDKAIGLDTADVEARLVRSLEQLDDLDNEIGMLRELVRILDHEPRMPVAPHIADHLDAIGLSA